MKVAVFGTAKRGSLSAGTLEALQAATTLAETDRTLWLWESGEKSGDIPDIPVEKVFLLGKKHAIASSMLETLSALIQQEGPHILLFSPEIWLREVAVRLSVQLQCGCMLGCNQAEQKEGNIIIRRPIYGGNVLAAYQIERYPYILSLQEGAYSPYAPGKETYSGKRLECPLPWQEPSNILEQSIEDEQENGMKTPVVIAGGRGIQTEQDMELLKQLAALLGASVGGTRPLVMSGKAAYEQLIGQSGKSVSPELCLLVAVSGASPFLVGIQGAKKIIAINQDKNAGVFHTCDEGLVADYREVLSQTIQFLGEKK